MSDKLAVAGLVLGYIALPIIWILKVLLWILLTLAAPFLAAGRLLLHICALPIHFLARFETLFIYFGVAGLVGVSAGAIAYYAVRLVASTLNMDSASEARGRTAASYRAERAARESKKAREDVLRLGLQRRLDKAPMDVYSDWMRHDKSEASTPGGLMSTTILEEESSDGFG